MRPSSPPPWAAGAALLRLLGGSCILCWRWQLFGDEQRDLPLPGVFYRTYLLSNSQRNQTWIFCSVKLRGEKENIFRPLNIFILQQFFFYSSTEQFCQWLQGEARAELILWGSRGTTTLPFHLALSLHQISKVRGFYWSTPDVFYTEFCPLWTPSQQSWQLWWFSLHVCESPDHHSLLISITGCASLWNGEDLVGFRALKHWAVQAVGPRGWFLAADCVPGLSTCSQGTRSPCSEGTGSVPASSGMIAWSF